MFHYDRNIVIMAYRAAHPSRREVDEARLEQFDQTLHSLYDAEVTRRADDEGILLDFSLRSMVVYFADRSDAKMISTRVGHALAYFQYARPRPWPGPPIV